MFDMNMIKDVFDFNREVLKIPPKPCPRILVDDEHEFMEIALDEERYEFADAKTLNDQADALLDTIYFALGGLYKMGLKEADVAFLWNGVHKANMQKKLGKTGRNKIDAVKPEGWQAPQGLVPNDIYKVTQKDFDMPYDFPLFKKAMDICAKKGEDYNAGSVQFEDYFPFGHKSYVQMLHLKALRLVSLVEKTEAPNFEGIEDTVLDMVVYANQYYKDISNGNLK